MGDVGRSRFESSPDGEVDAWRAAFAAADPFPHVVVDDFLEDIPSLIDSFPASDWDAWNRMGERYQHGKRFCSELGQIPDRLRETIVRLNSPPVLGTLERITGIPRLIPDPYLDGAGLHASGPGGVLLPHTDFHHHPLGLYRRLNLLVYLNDDWSERDGGILELFPDAAASEEPRRVVPVAGRAVLFRTDDQSVHGFTEPVGPGKERRSIALYYYTADEASTYSGDRTTLWRHHGDHRGVDKLRLQLHRGLLRMSRRFSRLAHRADPNRGDEGLA